MKATGISVTALVPFTLLLTLCIVVSCGIFQKFHQITNKHLKLSFIGYLISLCIACLSYMVFNIAELTHASWYFDESTLEFIQTVALIMRFVSYAAIYILIGYFVKVKLENVYYRTFLAVNPYFLNIIFILYIISASFATVFFLIVKCFSYWDPNLSNNPYKNIWTFATWQFAIYLNIYYIIILIMFNRNLHKFISLTLSNDQTLSSEINDRLKNEIIKQTNLMSFIINVSFIYQIFFFLHWIRYPEHDRIRMAYNIFYCLFLGCSTISIYLTFNSNAYWYHKCCEYSHLCCIYVCTKSVHLDPRNRNMSFHDHTQDSKPQIERQISEPHTFEMVDLSDTIDDDISCNVDECRSCSKLCRLLDQYDKDGVHLTPTNYDYTCSDILNDFQHLLEFHDSADDFKYIYNQLNGFKDARKCEFRTCAIFSRNLTRRRNRNVDSECEQKQFNIAIDREIFDIKQNILDKIHSFYYHSYDTYLRSEDTQIERANEAFRSRRKQNKNNESFLMNTSNKFSSNFDINEDQNNQNKAKHVLTYSFGQRFEYEDSQNKWYIKPKYKQLKQELVENHICCISMDVYNDEYAKCHKYMNTKRVKRLRTQNKTQTLTQHHILILLIYCNCDKFQNKWSETYRANNKETDTSLKDRHSHFYFCSMFLRQLIEDFGDRLMDCVNINKVFYHGVNQLLFLTRTTTQFNGPLSTSTEVNVALNFCGGAGMILQLKYSYSTYPLNAKYFDCAFFSDYVVEKECLFLGGVPVMIITNIIDMNNGQIYAKYINALNIINCLLNGTFEPMNDNNNYKVNKYAIELCCALLRYKLDDDDDDDSREHKLPQYVTNLLNEYCDNLTNIMIFWHNLQCKTMYKILELFCNQQNENLFFDFDILFKLFPNLQQIEYFNINHLGSETQKVVEYVMQTNPINDTRLRYLIIHRQQYIFSCTCYRNNNKLNEYIEICLGAALFQDDAKIIIYQSDKKLDVKSLSLRFNQINQASASTQMIQNCFQDLIH